MLIGVVSDNHGLIDPALPRVLEGVAEIWHAGDLVETDILEVLARIAPVIAVRGNNDREASVSRLPEEEVLEREGYRVLLRHIVGKPPRIDAAARRSITSARPRIVVAGHSHQPFAGTHDGVLYLNSGSCGPRRFKLPRTAARLELGQRQAVFEIVDLDSGEKTVSRFDLD